MRLSLLLTSVAAFVCAGFITMSYADQQNAPALQPAQNTAAQANQVQNAPAAQPAQNTVAQTAQNAVSQANQSQNNNVPQNPMRLARGNECPAASGSYCADATPVSCGSDPYHFAKSLPDF